MAESELSKTVASQQEKSSNSYYYWHSSVPSGETAAPAAKPQLLAKELAGPELNVKSISAYSLLDDGEVVKVYVALEGELEEVTSDMIETEFTSRSLSVTLTTPRALHRLHVAQESHMASGGLDLG
jgi:hypothetical protein